MHVIGVLNNALETSSGMTFSVGGGDNKSTGKSLGVSFFEEVAVVIFVLA